MLVYEYHEVKCEDELVQTEGDLILRSATALVHQAAGEPCGYEVFVRGHWAGYVPAREHAERLVRERVGA